MTQVAAAGARQLGVWSSRSSSTISSRSLLFSSCSWMARQAQQERYLAAASASIASMRCHYKEENGTGNTNTTSWGKASAFGAAAGISMGGMGMTLCDAAAAVEAPQQEDKHHHHHHHHHHQEEEESSLARKKESPAPPTDSSVRRLNATSPVLVSVSSPLRVTKEYEDDLEEDTTHNMSKGEARLEAATAEATKHSTGMRLFSGNGNRDLAAQVAKALRTNLGRATVGRFADGEVSVRVSENVRGRDVYIIQPTCPPGVNDNMMELLLMVATLKRANAERVTAIIPYYGYARYDQKLQSGVPIAAADVARLLEAAGVDRVVAVDLHRPQIQGFFGPDTPVDNLNGFIVGVDYFGSKRHSLHRPVVVSPDVDGVHRARKFKEGLEVKYGVRHVGLATIVRHRPVSGMYDTMDLVGDVTGCDCIIVDDIIDSASVLCRAVDVLKDRGARRVYAFVSHGVLSGPGNERIAQSALTECVILDTLPTTPQRNANEKLVTLSIAPLLAQTIAYLHAQNSLSSLMKAQQQPVEEEEEEEEGKAAA